jgi:hypothetical protein
VAFYNSNNSITGNNKLVWDVVNSSLLINNSTYDGYSNLINTGKSLFNNSGSTISPSHLGYGASTIIASSAQSPLRILRPGGQPNIFIGTNSQVPASTNFLFGIRTGAWFDTTTPTYSGDYAAMVVEKYLGGSGWGASVNVANLRMFTYFTCNGNNSRKALMIYPLPVETATNTDVVYVNNLYIASAGYFGSTVNARLHIRGDGTTTATNSIYIDNDLGTKLLSLSDDGQLLVGTGVYAGFKLDVAGNSRIAGTLTVDKILGGTATSATGNYSLAYGVQSQSSGAYSFAFGRQAQADSELSFALGGRSRTYLWGQFAQSSVLFTYGNFPPYYGVAQSSTLNPYRINTSLSSGASFNLSLDGSGTLNLIIPDGNNRVWNVVIESIAVVDSITGTATGVSVGDVYIETKKLLFKRRSGTSSIVGTIDTTGVKSNTSMSTAAFTITAGASQEMAITFTAPIVFATSSNSSK